MTADTAILELERKLMELDRTIKAAEQARELVVDATLHRRNAIAARIFARTLAAARTTRSWSSISPGSAPCSPRASRAWPVAMPGGEHDFPIRDRSHACSDGASRRGGTSSSPERSSGSSSKRGPRARA